VEALVECGGVQIMWDGIIDGYACPYLKQGNVSLTTTVVSMYGFPSLLVNGASSVHLVSFTLIPVKQFPWFLLSLAWCIKASR
jgi:hypothetical protein